MNHTHRQPTTAKHASARGMTLLEVLLAVLMLSFTIGGVMAAISSIVKMEGNGRRRLAAYEVANRLILMYLDDDNSLPSKGLPIAYGSHKFFWDLDETGATMVISHKQESSGANLQSLDRYQLVGVTVFESAGEEGSEVKGEPIAWLSRLIDPTAARNPDSMQTFDKNPDKIGQLIGVITGTRTSRSSGDTIRSGRKLK